MTRDAIGNQQADWLVVKLKTYPNAQ